MSQPPPLPALLTTLPFHISEAQRLGVPGSRLRRADLSTPFRGVRAAASPTSVEELCLAYLPLLRDGWFSHSTAATLWGMWLPKRLASDDALHVSAPWPSREPRRRGVIGHRVDAARTIVSVLRGIPLTAPVECWCQLSALLTLDELVVAGESLVARKNPLSDLHSMSDAIRRYAGRRGAAQLPRALERLRGRADSPKEVELRLLLVRCGLPEPAVNLRIVDEEGTLFGDLAYPTWMTLVEYDGRHHVEPRQAAADILRLERLTRAGWTVIRVMQEHLEHPDQIARRVARALHDSGWRPARSKLQLLR